MSGCLRRNNNGAANRKRTQVGNNKKKINPQKELDDNLLTIDTVDAESCWKIYRLHEDACTLHIPPQPKPKNCKQNPYCIHRLGFEKFEKVFQSVQEGKSAADIIVRRNRQEQPCGLVNPGNYCYLNSFLQIWFNDIRFRQCIFDWRPHSKWTKPESAKLDIQEVLNCLQRLFITLQNTPFDSTDPKDFINLLRLDNEQQDVQEFHTLFFDTLERNLQLHPNGETIHRTINELFLSRIRQSTFCSHCGNQSIAHCEYRSLLLSIDGLNSLDSAINKFFEPENLSDFKCECGKTGGTNKLMEFEMLPQVLIIQLIRYVYDSVKEQHRKLKTAISYPRTLKARKLKQDGNNDEEYELSAVMIHEGPNSHCGHYYDIIRDPLSNRWFTYNDKRVVAEKRAPGYEANKEPTNQRATNDQKGCYALIYQRKKLPAKKNAKIEFRMPPDDVVRNVCKKLEDDFARQSKEGTRSNQLWEYRIKQRYAYLSKLINEFEVDKGRAYLKKPEEIVFIPTSILIDLFAKEHEAIIDMHTIDDKMLQPSQQRQPKEENMDEDKEENNKNIINNDNNGHKPLSRQARSAGSHPQLARSDSLFSFDGMGHDGDDANGQKENQNCLTSYEDVYAPEPLAEVKFDVCEHNNVPLKAVLKGELKAVRELGAQRLISDFNVRLFYYTYGEQIKSSSDEALIENGKTNGIADDQPCTSASLAKSPVNIKENGNQLMNTNGIRKRDLENKRFLTGADLCWDCIKNLKNQANFRNDLSETENQLAETLKNLTKRAYDPNKPNQLMVIDPPQNALWFSLKDLREFKKIALKQKENTNDLNMDDDDEPIEKRSKDDDIDDGNENEDLQPHKNDSDVVIVDDDEGNNVRNGVESVTEFQDEEDNDIELNENPAERIPNLTEFDDQGREIFDDPTEVIEDISEEKPIIKFNQDIYCKHGKLSNNTKRAWLTEEEWNKMKWCFVEYSEPIPCTAQECLKCIENRDIVNLIRDNSLDQLQALQNEIKVLLNKIAIRRPGEEKTDKPYTHVICKEFVTKMRNMSRARQKIIQIPAICQHCLLCDHGRPYFPLTSENDQEAAINLFPIFAQNKGKNEAGHPEGIPLFDWEWRELINAYMRHADDRIQPTDILLGENCQYLHFCDTCFLEFTRSEEMKQYIYPEGANIFVKKQEERDDKPNASGSSSRPAIITTRRCAQKNVLKVKISSDQTIMDLKLELMKQTQQSPLDQLLYRDEHILEDDLTLEASRVPANNQANPLILILQQHDTYDTSGGNNDAAGGSSQKPREREKGFKDTALA